MKVINMTWQEFIVAEIVIKHGIISGSKGPHKIGIHNPAQCRLYAKITSLFNFRYPKRT